MNYHKFIITFLIGFFLGLSGYGQALPRQYTPEQVIEIAQLQSPNALSAKNQFLKSFWEFRAAKAELLRKLNLDAQLPNL